MNDGENILIQDNEDFFDDHIFIDNDFKNNPCLKSVYNQMGKASTFNNYLQNFDGNSSVTNLRFSASSNLPSNTNAETSPPDNYLITVTFNTNNLNRPSLDVARTMIHEMIHAEIFRKLLSVAQQPNLNFTQWYAQDPNSWYSFVISLKDNFEGLYDYYMRLEWGIQPGQTPSDAQHNLMAEHYRDIIKQVLTEFDNSQNNSVYEALAWSGLMGSGQFDWSTGLPANPTVAWSNLTQTQRLNILQTISNFKNNNPNCP